MTPELEDVLQHYGVKGMKWGKVKSSVKKKTDGVKETAKTHVKSIKRERSWNKTLSKANELSTKDLQKVSQRAQLENDMKRLSKNVGSAKEKKDYLKRGDMNDQELFRKVQRLRAKDSLNRNANEATKQQKAIAKKVVQVAAPLVLSYALTGRIGKKDLMNAVLSASGAHGKAVKTITDMVNKEKKKSTVKQGDNMDDILLHSMLEEIETPQEVVLQHYGVKGMKWGKRKLSEKIADVKAQGAARKERIKSDANTARRRKKGEITRKQANEERWASFHKEQSVNKHYKNSYDKLKSKGMDDKKAMRRAYNQAQARKRAQTAMLTKVAVGGIAAAKVGVAVGKVGVTVGKHVATNPDVIMKGKNLVQAMKRSPIRYVDGKKMKNVINF